MHVVIDGLRPLLPAKVVQYLPASQPTVADEPATSE